MTWTEEPVLFGARPSLVGILTCPSNLEPSRPAVLLLNAGQIHRSGPFRLHVKLARQLASLGLPAMRFDFSGVGDSLRREDDIPENRANVLETREAMDYLESGWGVRRFLAIGICRGAWVSFAAASQDPRLVGLVLVNPDTLADDRQSTIRRDLNASARVEGFLSRPASWLRVALHPWRYAAQAREMISHLARPLRQGARLTEAEQVASRLSALSRRGVDTLCISSAGDSSQKYLQAIMRYAQARVELQMLPQADHVFFSLASQRQLTDVVKTWSARFILEGSAARTIDGKAGI